MDNKFKVIDYITRKRKISRDLMIKYKIPQYCFNSFFIAKKVPDTLDVLTNTTTLAIELFRLDFNNPSNGTDPHVHIMSIPAEELDKTDEQIKQEVLDECLLRVNEEYDKKINHMTSLMTKAHKLMQNRKDIALLKVGLK